MDELEYKDGHQQRVLKITRGEYIVQCHIVTQDPLMMLCEKKKSFLIIAYMYK